MCLEAKFTYFWGIPSCLMCMCKIASLRSFHKGMGEHFESPRRRTPRWVVEIKIDAFFSPNHIFPSFPSHLSLPPLLALFMPLSLWKQHQEIHERGARSGNATSAPRAGWRVRMSHVVFRDFIPRIDRPGGSGRGTIFGHRTYFVGFCGALEKAYIWVKGLKGPE